MVTEKGHHGGHRGGERMKDAHSGGDTGSKSMVKGKEVGTGGVKGDKRDLLRVQRRR